MATSMNVVVFMGRIVLARMEVILIIHKIDILSLIKTKEIQF